MHILQLILGHLIVWASVDIGGYFIVALFERSILTLDHFSDVFSDMELVHIGHVYRTIF